MARLTPMTLSEANALGKAFGLEISSFSALEDGSVNSNFRLQTTRGQVFFARVYEEQAPSGALGELRLLRELAQAGVPTVVPPTPISVPEPLIHQGKPFAIYPWVEGEILCQRRVTPLHVAALGESLAKLHLASDKLSQLPEGRFAPDKMIERLASVEAQLTQETQDRSQPELREATRFIRTKLDHYAGERDASLPRGIIHGDLFRDNVLWAHGAIAALLDFESASTGTFVYDLMVCVEAWCFTERFEPALVSALVDGYQRVRPLSSSELSGLGLEGALAALRFATTRITDFSLRALPGQAPKRDYRRFIERLKQIEAGALRHVTPA